MTRQVLYSVAMSLDGYIAGPQGEADWIPRDPSMDWNAFMSRFDTVLIGRKTFELFGKAGSGAGFPGMRAIVFSRSLRPEEYPRVTIRPDAAATVRDLKTQPGKDIWLMGGGELFRSLMEEGLVDGVEVGICPVLLGGGLPFLPPTPRRVRLALTKRNDSPSGIVGLSYSVIRTRAGRRTAARAR